MPSTLRRASRRTGRRPEYHSSAPEFSIGPSWTRRSPGAISRLSPRPSSPPPFPRRRARRPPSRAASRRAWWRGPRRSRAVPPAPRTPRRGRAHRRRRSAPCASPAVRAQTTAAAGRPGPPPLPSGCRRPSRRRPCPRRPAVPHPHDKGAGGERGEERQVEADERPRPRAATPSRSARRAARWPDTRAARSAAA